MVGSYRVSFDEELRQVHWAVDHYIEMARLIAASKGAHLESLTHYYRKLSNAPESVLRFRALFFAMRLQPVLSWIRQFTAQHNRGPAVLDVGCRFGMETILISLAGAATHGIDAEDHAIEEADRFKAAFERQQQGGLPIQYQVADLFTFTPPQAYDAVYSSATMHHIEPAGLACAAVGRLTKPGGWFFLSDENGLSPIQQVAVQRRIGWRRPRTYWMTNPATGEKFLYGNENIRPPFVWARHLRKAGLEPRAIKYVRFAPPADLSLERLVKLERRLRVIPALAQFWAIGFLMATQRAQTEV
jgi:SAM-dependent methyltransferase